MNLSRMLGGKKLSATQNQEGKKGLVTSMRAKRNLCAVVAVLLGALIISFAIATDDQPTAETPIYSHVK